MRDAIVIGAGPAGLATAAMLRAAGVAVELLDRTGEVGGAYARMDPAVVMTSPATLIGLPGAPRAGGGYLTARAYHDYLARYARDHALAPTRAEVSRVVRDGAGFRIEADVGTRRAGAVVVATGMFDHPFVPAIPGVPAVPTDHAATWRSGRARRGERVLVVGGASSAIEIAEDAARSGALVTIAARRIALSRASWLGIDPAHVLFPILARARPRRFCAGEVTVPGVDRGYAAWLARGAITRRREPVRIDGDRATFADGGAAIAIDRLVLATGYRWTAPFLPADLDRTPRGAPRCRDNESCSHRGVFVVGSPCARSAASQYLYGISRDAVAVARAIAAR